VILLSPFSAELSSDLQIERYLISAGIALLISYLSYKVKFLTRGGAAATFILAVFIFGLGGIKWSVPILTFFILSSILSKLRKKRNPGVESLFEKSGVRDHFQVLANGGLGGILVIANALRPDELFYLLYLASLSAACADTWATEIGTWKKTATYNILNLKPVPQGTSGGISLMGSAGALLGSLVISFSGIAWSEISYIQFIILILFAGLAGSFIDSLLGATVQNQNRCQICNEITERKFHCGMKTDHFKGSVLIDNDAVNFLSSAAGGILSLAIYSIIKF
jgi:uncharacterized protein (TIGR00297 family)